MKQLNNRQRKSLANYNRRVAKNRSGFKKHSMKVNSSALLMWLKGHNIHDVPQEFMGILLQITRGYLYSHLDTTGEAKQFFFGAGLDKDHNELMLLGKIERAISRHDRRVESDRKLIDIREAYKKKFGNRAPDGASEAWLRNEVRVGVSHKVLASSNGEFQSRLRKTRVRHARQVEPTGRMLGCALDEQAKELGIYDKEHTVNIRRKKKNEETGVVENVIVETLTKPYCELSRNQRKRINHRAHKAANA